MGLALIVTVNCAAGTIKAFTPPKPVFGSTTLFGAHHNQNGRKRTGDLWLVVVLVVVGRGWCGRIISVLHIMSTRHKSRLLFLVSHEFTMLLHQFEVSPRDAPRGKYSHLFPDTVSFRKTRNSIPTAPIVSSNKDKYGIRLYPISPKPFLVGLLW